MCQKKLFREWQMKNTTLNKSYFHQIAADMRENFRIKCYLFLRKETGKKDKKEKHFRENFQKQFARVSCIINFIFMPVFFSLFWSYICGESWGLNELEIIVQYRKTTMEIADTKEFLLL
jgi:hypothetical protein